MSPSKVLCSNVQASVARKAIQIHGGIGASWDLPFADMLTGGLILGIADGPSEVHVQVVAKEMLRGYSGTRDSHGYVPDCSSHNSYLIGSNTHSTQINTVGLIAIAIGNTEFQVRKIANFTYEIRYEDAENRYAFVVCASTCNFVGDPIP